MTPTSFPPLNKVKRETALCILEHQLAQCDAMKAAHTAHVACARLDVRAARVGGVFTVVGAVACLTSAEVGSAAFVLGALFVVHVWVFWNTVVKKEKEWAKAQHMEREMPEIEQEMRALQKQLQEEANNENRNPT
jgi:hypothetical protein